MTARRQPPPRTPVAATVLVWGTLALYLAAAVAFASDGIGDSPYDDGGPDHTAAKYLLVCALAGHAVSLVCIAGRIARRLRRRRTRSAP